MSNKNNILKVKDSTATQHIVYFPFLDGFRAIAIIMILAHDIRRAFNLDFLFVSNPPILKWVYFKSYQTFGVDLTGFYKGIQYVISQLKGVLGLEIFFVISGFLITGILLRKELNKGSVVRFYQRRFFRIYPNYALMVIVSLMIYEWQNHEGITTAIVTAVYHLLFLQNYFPPNPLLAHTWSMVVLEQFYFFCPLVILAVNWKVSQPRHRRNVLIGLCLLMMLTAQLIQLYYFNTKQPLISWPLKSTTPYWTITANLGSISFGALLAILEPHWSLWKNNRWLGLVLWVTGMAIFCYLFFVLDWSYYWGDWYLYTYGYLTVGLLIFAAYHGISLFVRLGCFQWLGRHSYGIYIWHYLVLEFWKIWIGTFPPEIIIIGCFVTSIAAGVLSTNTIERYFLTLRSKLVPSI